MYNQQHRPLESNMTITQAKLKKILHYEPEDAIITNKEARELISWRLCS